MDMPQIAARALREWDHIIQRRNAETQLQHRENVLNHAQEIAHVGSWEWNLKTHQVHWSTEMCRIHGVGRDEAPRTPEEYARFILPGEKRRSRLLDWSSQ